MTPGEERLNAWIRTAVADAVAPLHREIAALKAVDKRHSGVHSGLGAKLRESQSEIAVKVDDTVDAVARRDQQLVQAINDVRQEIVASREVTKTSIAPTAMAATEAATQARNAGIDLKLVKQDTARAAAWWRHPALPVVAYALVEALWKVFGATHAP